MKNWTRRTDSVMLSKIYWEYSCRLLVNDKLGDGAPYYRLKWGGCCIQWFKIDFGV